MAEQTVSQCGGARVADRILETGQVTEPDDWYAFQDANAPDRRLDGDPTPVPSVSGLAEI